MNIKRAFDILEKNFATMGNYPCTKEACQVFKSLVSNIYKIVDEMEHAADVTEITDTAIVAEAIHNWSRRLRTLVENEEKS
jgi:hypothetical protein